MEDLNFCESCNLINDSFMNVKGNEIHIDHAKNIVDSNDLFSFFYSLSLLFSQKVWISKNDVKRSVKEQLENLEKSSIYLTKFSYLNNDDEYFNLLKEHLIEKIKSEGMLFDENLGLFIKKIPTIFYSKLKDKIPDIESYDPRFENMSLTPNEKKVLVDVDSKPEIDVKHEVEQKDESSILINSEIRYIK